MPPFAGIYSQKPLIPTRPEPGCEASTPLFSAPYYYLPDNVTFQVSGDTTAVETMINQGTGGVNPLSRMNTSIDGWNIVCDDVANRQAFRVGAGSRTPYTATDWGTNLTVIAAIRLPVGTDLELFGPASGIGQRGSSVTIVAAPGIGSLYRTWNGGSVVSQSFNTVGEDTWVIVGHKQAFASFVSHWVNGVNRGIGGTAPPARSNLGAFGSITNSASNTTNLPEGSLIGDIAVFTSSIADATMTSHMNALLTKWS